MNYLESFVTFVACKILGLSDAVVAYPSFHSFLFFYFCFKNSFLWHNILLFLLLFCFLFFLILFCFNLFI